MSARARVWEASRLGYPSDMSRLVSRSRFAIASIAAALALGAAACGEEDVERGVGQGAKEAEDAGRDAGKAGEDAAGKAKKDAEAAKRELEK